MSVASPDKRGCRLPSLCGIIALCLFVVAGRADDQPASSIDQALERELNPKGQGEATERSAAVPRADQVPAEMQSAASLIQKHDLAAAAVRQAAVLRALDQMLNEAPRPAPEDGGEESDGAALGGVGPESSQDDGTSTGAGDGAARESSPQRSGAPATQSPRERRRDLATSVWGHLPDRLREQMQQTWHEHYLPGYEDLVESYYESLAEQRDRVP